MKWVVISMLAGLPALQAYSAEEPRAAKPPAESRTEEARAAQSRADVERRLEVARDRLEEAAREVASLSTELGAPLMERFMAFAGAQPRAIIGVQLDPESGKDGARIVEVSPGGPAEEAGLKRDDVIVALNGTELKGSERPVRELTQRMRQVAPDSKVKLRVLRDGKTRDVEITTRASHSVFAGRPMPPPPPLPADAADLPDLANLDVNVDFMHALRGELAGMELATLTPKLGQYFGTDKGVLVVRAPDSGSFRLQDGDVIVGIDGREPRSGSHATRILRSYQPGEKVKLRVMRQRKPVDLEVTLPEAGPKQRRVRLLMDGMKDTV
jgi:C-terminal processing protease CtpA/Prc